MLANLLLGYNIFKGASAEESRERIMTLPLPNFCQLNPRIDQRLNEILHRTLARDLSKRYATADELLYDLEYYIYHKGYGPTNETLGKFIRELFGQNVPRRRRQRADHRHRSARPSVCPEARGACRSNIEDPPKSRTAKPAPRRRWV